MVPVTLETMAPILIDAVLVSLDSDYLATDKIEAWDLLEPILTGNFVNELASITQLYLRLEDGIPDSRRTALDEASKVIHLERTYPREALLEQYLSRVALGRNTFGVEAASMTWFGVSSKDLKISQAAFLASQILKTNRVPSPDNSAETTLIQLREGGMVTEKEYLDHSEILTEGLGVRESPDNNIKPAILGVGLIPTLGKIYDELTDYYGREALIKGNMGVVSTVDLHLQSRIAEIAGEVVLATPSWQFAAVVLDDRNQLRAAFRTGDLSLEEIQLDFSSDIAWSTELIELGLVGESFEISLIQLAELHSVLGRGGTKYRTRAVLETFDTSGEQIDRFSHEKLEVFDSQITSKLNKELENLSTLDQKIGLLDGQIEVKGKHGVDVEKGITWYGGTSKRFAVAIWISDLSGQPIENSAAVTRVAGAIFSELHRDE
jgi:membrane peptidoglycan carboxypeptidase